MSLCSFLILIPPPCTQEGQDLCLKKNFETFFCTPSIAPQKENDFFENVVILKYEKRETYSANVEQANVSRVDMRCRGEVFVIVIVNVFRNKITNS